MKSIFHPTYFPQISQFSAMMKADEVVFEMEDNFQKQTNRTRTYIFSPNGKQLLNVPIKHATSPHQKTKDILIENAFDWQKQHFKSLEAAYRSSPYFEFFEYAFEPFFKKKHIFLMDLNLQSIELVCSCLQLKLDTNKTAEYIKNPTDCHDFRALANGKKDLLVLENYTQVFGNKHGFLNNLSILDLLFNEGKHALDYLKKQKING